MPTLTAFDALLIAAVSIQATILAYVADPRWKAIVLCIPVPFTMGALALHRPLDITHLSGAPLLWLFSEQVRWTHKRLKMPIVPAIGAATLVYVLLGCYLADKLPAGDAPFWLISAGTLALAATSLIFTRITADPPYRSPLPIWLKLPIIVAVVGFIIATKNALRGFAATFPIMSIVAFYEMRFSLDTACRKVPHYLVALVGLIAFCRIFQESLGLERSLLIGWAIYIALLIVVGRIDARTAAA